MLVLLALGCKGENLLPTEPTQPLAPPPPQETATVIATAAFRSANGYRTVGGARLEEDGDGNQAVRFDEDFETDRSGALDVRLCTRRRCGDDDLVLGRLQSFRGAQGYEVSGDGSEYEFVVIWCTAVELAFGTGRLE